MNLHQLIEQFFNYISVFPKDTVNLILLGILFVGSIIESLPVLGMFFPMETYTVILGTFAYKGIVDLKTAILTAFLGLLIGDIIGFYLGRKLGEEYIKSHAKKLKITHEKYNRLKFLINNNLVKALFIGRTTNITRWIVPFLAGANNAHFKKFVLANIITGLFWSSVFILGGYFLGDIFEVYGKYFGLGVLAATVIAYFIYRFYKHYQKYFQKEDTKLLILNIFGLYLFSKMLEDVTDLELITKWDFYISSHIHEIYNPLLNKIMIFITSLDNPLEVTIISFLIVLFLVLKKIYKKALFFAISVGGAGILVEIIKTIVKRPRPPHYLIEVSGYSFPSGHATLSTALAFSLYLILKDKVNKKILLIFCIIYPLLISFSRVYLNVHYLSDVIAGIGLGLFWVSLVAIFFKIKGFR